MADGSDQVISIGVNQYQIIFRDTREDAAALIVKNQKSKIKKTAFWGYCKPIRQ
jgi:hypothetical protein